MIKLEQEHYWSIEADVSVEYAFGCFSLKIDSFYFTVDIDRFGNTRWRWRNGPFASVKNVVKALVRWDGKKGETLFPEQDRVHLEAFAECLKSMLSGLNHQVVKQVAASIQEKEDRKRQEEIQLLAELQNHQGSVAQYVYLFRHSNGLTKIGMSRDPCKREKTLQAEDPRLHMIAYRKGGSSLESRLHRIFADRRVRGEWFDLSEKDVDWVTWMLGFNSGWHKAVRQKPVAMTREVKSRLISQQLDKELA